MTIENVYKECLRYNNIIKHTKDIKDCELADMIYALYYHYIMDMKK